MQLDVVKFGDPVLRQKAEPVGEIDDRVRKLAENMIETMRAENGLGLAAEQVGETLAMCVVEIPPDYDCDFEGGPRLNPDVEMPMVLINPEIKSESGKVVVDEGCLSFPGISAPISRAEEVTVEFQGLDGESRAATVCSMLARAVQHEIDHLNGMLLVDRMSPVKKISLSGKLKSLKKQTQAALR